MSMEPREPASRLHVLIERAITDQDFADRIVDPEQQAGALEEMGFEPTPDVIHELNHSIDHLRSLWETFGETKYAS
jgi:hypothetical protein